MEIKTEEVFHNGDAPFNRIHAAVGVYQNTGQGQQDSLIKIATFIVEVAQVSAPLIFIDLLKSLYLWW